MFLSTEGSALSEPNNIGATLSQPNHEALVAALIAGLDKAFQARHQGHLALLELEAAKHDLLVQHAECAKAWFVDVDNQSGDKLRRYLAEMKEFYGRLDSARKAYLTAAQTVQAKLAALKKANDQLNSLREKAIADVECERLAAALELAVKMKAEINHLMARLESYSHSAALETAVALEKRRAISEHEKAKQASALKHCEETLERVILVHEKALAAMTEAKASLDTIDELTTGKIAEPRKPTSEEVSRYLSDLRVWAEADLVAQRAAAKHVQTMREYQATLERDLKRAQLAYDKVKHFNARAVDYQVDAQITGTGTLLEAIAKLSRNWRFFCNSWAERKFNKTEPFTDIRPEELEAIEHLEASIRNVVVAVATKYNSRLKYNSVKDVYTFKQLRRNIAPYEELEDLLREVENVLKKEEEVKAINESRSNEIELAWDNFQSHTAAAREIASNTMKLANRLERTLLTPRADQLTLVLNTVARLHSLHAGYASYGYLYQS
jgi:hypothetical protein